MTPKTLRRKLQKKMKHKPYRKCLKCGNRMVCRLESTDTEMETKLFKVCKVYKKDGCGFTEELHWLGGGTGRHIPHG